MKNIKTIIFDFDGVIADTLPFTFKKIIEIAKMLKVENMTDAAIIREIRSKSYQELLTGGMNISWFRLPMMIGLVRKMQEELYRQIDTIKVFPGIKILLNDLKKNKFKLMILSSNLKKNVDRFIDKHNLGFFDEIDCGSHILGKAAAIDNFLRKNNLEKEKTIYVGDEIRDVDACRQINMKIIAIAWGLNSEESLRRHGADFIAKKPADILKIVEG